MLRKLLLDPNVAVSMQDEAALLGAHRDAVLKKPLLRSTFDTFYQEAGNAGDRWATASVKLREIELGAGSSLFNLRRPWLQLTDVRRAEWLAYLDAQQMNLPDASVRAFYAILMFHHLPQPARFFDELTRTLHPGGVAVLIEPFHSPLSRAVHSRLHATEFYDLHAGWETPVKSAMNGANQALSSIVFRRDRAKFEAGWPNLEVVETRPIHNWLRYLASGGVNFRAMAPGRSGPMLERIERALAPVTGIACCLHWMIVLRRR